MSTVVFEQVSLSYGSIRAVQDATFAIPRGTLFGLLGPNGAGKSTCLKMITTLLVPTAGRVSVNGFDTTDEPMAVRRSIGYAPEEPLIYAGLTAREFVELSAELHGLDPKSARAATVEVLAHMELSERADDTVATFSKGMRRKVLIAAALAHDPAVLVMDEPLDGLDVIAQARLKDLLRERVARGKTVVYSTHIIEVVESLCTHVALLEQGRLVASDDIAAVKRSLGVDTLIDAFLQRAAADGAGAASSG